MKKIRKSNKGFTLVELIIVIAIIAILTAVAAPQYIKYVEKSRISKDENNAASIQTAIETAIVDLNSDDDSTNDVANCGASESFSVTFSASGITAPADNHLQDALEETLGGTFASNVNPILKTTQKTNPTCTLLFTEGKFTSATWN